MTQRVVGKVKFRDIQYDLSHNEIKRLLNLIKKRYPEKKFDIHYNFLSNCSRLTELLNELGYEGDVIYKDIRAWIRAKPHGGERLEEPKEGAMPREPEVLLLDIPEIPEIDITEIPEINIPKATEIKIPEIKTSKTSELIEQLMEARKQIDERIKELIQIENVREEIEDIMNVPASDTPVARPQEERYTEYVNEATSGHLKGDINKDLSPELTKYIDKHKLVHIDNLYSEEAIILIPPIDRDKFNASLRRVGYKMNSLKKEDHKIYIDYYINRVTQINIVFDHLDQIFEENKGQAFKIGFDCGFVVENTKDITYKTTAPNSDEVGRSIPVIIKTQEDMNTYKHYVYAAVSEKTERIHENSNNRYCAIHTFLFKVTKLGQSGARILIPGYDFLARNKYIKVMPNLKNLCMLCAMY